MSKKALIIAYYFPPCNFIGANRPFSWANNFHHHGIHSTVVTRHWEGNENLWEDYQKTNATPYSEEEKNGYKVIRLPYIVPSKNKLLGSLLKLKPFSKTYHLYLNLKGDFHTEVNARSPLKDFLIDHLKTNKYDFIIVSSPPLNVVRLGYELSKKFDIPFIVDFRDLWNNDLLNPEIKLPVRNKIFNWIYERYLAKWLKHAALTISVSQPLIDQIERVTNSQKMVVTNGYEKDLFKGVELIPKKKFVVSLIGTLYAQQNLEILFKGFDGFLKGKDTDKVVINFIGTSSIPAVREQIEKKLPMQFLNVTERMNRKDAVSIMVNSDVLFYAGWPGYRGRYSGKIFEYLGSGRNILIAPGDKDAIDQIVTFTKAGKIANTSEEVSSILNDWYNEWEKNGKLEYIGNREEIEKYTREEQLKKISRFINEKSLV